ncbi:hypothetical protein TNCV_4840871 [Trichonephila clavipes]|nr:hypothetical protein TNCV_4840871 [Trichonephila clavipes]
MRDGRSLPTTGDVINQRPGLVSREVLVLSGTELELMPRRSIKSGARNLPAPGNRSNERRYREKGSGNDERKKGRKRREERGRRRGRVDTAERFIVIL